MAETLRSGQLQALDGYYSFNNNDNGATNIDGYNILISYYQNNSMPNSYGYDGTFITNGSTGTAATIYYRMRGYYIAGLTYEYWTATGAPNTTPPSGHSLDNIVIIASWSE